jgi:hypothetical protein
MSTTIKNWQQSNVFTVTLRGHEQDIPLPEDPVRQDEFDVVAASKSDINSLLTTFGEKVNYNTLYDSYYAPTDFKLRAITFRLPEQLPDNMEYNISFKVNGAEIDLFPIPELQDSNQKIYGTECDVHIWEDDFIQVSVEIDQGQWSRLSWGNHNMTVGVSGCVWYEEYASIFLDYLSSIPDEKSWTEGDAFFKTNITLQNRSGNDIFSDRVFADIVKSPMSFLLQSVRISMFEDELMTDEKLPRTGSCFLVDILANGRSVNEILNLPRPAAIDSIDQNLLSYNSTHNNVAGFPIIIGDDILIKIYQRNITAKYNSKIMQVILIGCAQDCLTLIATPVSIYELCTTEPCVAKFTADRKCDTVPVKKNPIILCNK